MLMERRRQGLVECHAAEGVVPLEKAVEVRRIDRGLAWRARVLELGASDHAERRVVSEIHAAVERQCGVGELVVHALVVRAQARGAKRVVELARRASHRRGAVPCVERPGLDGGRPVRMRIHWVGAFREELDHTRHRIRSVERRKRAAHDFDAIQVVGREVAEVERAARLVDRNAVDHHLVVVALAAADEERRHAAGRARANDHRARRRAQKIRDERLAPRLEILGGKHGRRCPDLAGRRFGPGRGDDHGFLDWRQRQRQPHRAGRAR